VNYQTSKIILYAHC